MDVVLARVLACDVSGALGYMWFTWEPSSLDQPPCSEGDMVPVASSRKEDHSYGLPMIRMRGFGFCSIPSGEVNGQGYQQWDQRAGRQKRAGGFMMGFHPKNC